MATAEQEVRTAADAPLAELEDDATQGTERGLLLDSLEVRNFRAFRHLAIPKLGRVNLVTGTNGVGKSSLLEALYLYAYSAAPQAVRELLLSRREVLGSALRGSSSAATVDLRALFNGTKNSQLSQSWSLDGSRKTFGVIQKCGLFFELISDPNPAVLDETIEVYSDFSSMDQYDYPARMIREGLSSTGQPLAATFPDVACAFLRAGTQSGNDLAKQWDGINLTSLEDIVLQALRLINKNVQRVSFIAEAQSPLGRVSVVKLSDSQRPVPMARLGEGLTRAFAIALALTNSKDGFLLVDEIDNGLHYSLLPDLWRLIFQTARDLDVQVFAATHNWDCIEAFQKAAAEDDDPTSGVLIRLQNTDGDVTATVFDERRLAIVTRDGIEVR